MKARNNSVFFMLLLVELIQLALVPLKQVHQDEYRFIEQIFSFESGLLGSSVQTFYVYLFQWLTWLPLNDIDKIVAGRFVMWLCHLSTLFFVYGIAKKLSTKTGALIAALVYATMFYVLQHATSFRADPLITALLMGAIFGLTRNNASYRNLIASAMSVALAGLISIKSVFYLPMIAVAGLWQFSRTRRKRLFIRTAVGAAVIAILVFLGLFFLHSRELGASTANPIGYILGSIEKQFGEKQPFDTTWYLFVAVIFNIPNWILIFIGLYHSAALATSRDREIRNRALVALSFILPILLVFIYRNSFPYFYVFMLAPISVIAAFSCPPGRNTAVARLAVPVGGLLTILALFLGGKELSNNNLGQRSMLAAVTGIFPEPVPYIDGFSSVPSYPRVGPFLTSWVMDNYRRQGQRRIAMLVTERKPRFVIAQHPMILDALTEGAAVPQERYSLFPEDAAALHDNFIPHWGQLWIAGKRLEADKSGRRRLRTRHRRRLHIRSEGRRRSRRRRDPARRRRETRSWLAPLLGTASDPAVWRPCSSSRTARRRRRSIVKIPQVVFNVACKWPDRQMTAISDRLLERISTDQKPLS